jgi:hypothetical protein
MATDPSGEFHRISLPPPSVPVPSMRGSTFREFVRWFEQTFGRGRALSIYDRLPAGLTVGLSRDAEVFGLLPSAWYPMELVHRLLEMATEGLGPRDRAAMVREGARQAVTATLKGIYQAIYRALATPELHARYTSRVWALYYNTGVVKGTMLGPNKSERTVHRWTGHHILLCETTAEALGVMHERMGLKGVSVARAACVDRGGPECRFVLTWGDG